MNKPLKKLCLASGVALAFGAQADTFNVTATVDNAITLNETTPFSIGSVYITAETVQTAADAAILTIDETGAATPTATAEASGLSQIVALGGASTGLLSIAGAASFTSITVTPRLNTDMAHSSGSPTVPDILINQIDVWDASDTTTTADTTTGTPMTVTTDATGAADIIVGGIFMADDNAVAASYEDGTYTGTYDVDVAY